jgi:iron only hydrogenase large subunit-like protein
MNAIQPKARQVPVIAVDEDKCVNCHMCIAVCPVKYCIDGSGDKVSINDDLCIGCGSCVRACTHDARSIMDDAAEFLNALSRGEKIVAVVAPALASSFPGQYRQFMGWLKSLGVSACFDVSFGAELTVKSYLNHISTNKPALVVAQPCPAIVSYVEIFRPELLPHLAPADSPMLHTIKMIRDYYQGYKGSKILIVSPCAAKKREFVETGLGDYNVTIRSFKDILDKRRIDLSSQPEADFDNPPAERAVLFSSPGGLLRTAIREVPGIQSMARKIEGPELVYHYLDSLPASMERGINPLLVDCLNCEFGCNAGPGTLNQGKSPDEIEYPVEKRSLESQRVYGGRKLSDRTAARNLKKVLARFWKPGQYDRTYVNRSANYRLVRPSENELKVIYGSMLKQTPEDHLNCAGCGYKSCEGMAIAIHNRLNKKENCHLYRQKVIESERQIVDSSTIRLHDEIIQATAMVGTIRNSLERLQADAASQFAAIEQSAASVEEMVATLGNASSIAAGRRQQIQALAESTAGGERDMIATAGAIRKAADGITGIGNMIGVIHDVADKTNLLAMNAAIQAAHAGSAGKSFAVVASEIRKLAEATGGNAKDIATSIGGIINQIKTSNEMTDRTGKHIKMISQDTGKLADEMSALIDSFTEMSTGGTQVTKGIEVLRSVSLEVRDVYATMVSDIGDILNKINTIARISEETQQKVNQASHQN